MCTVAHCTHCPHCYTPDDVGHGALALSADGRRAVALLTQRRHRAHPDAAAAAPLQLLQLISATAAAGAARLRRRRLLRELAQKRLPHTTHVEVRRHFVEAHHLRSLSVNEKPNMCSEAGAQMSVLRHIKHMQVMADHIIERDKVRMKHPQTTTCCKAVFSSRRDSRELLKDSQSERQVLLRLGHLLPQLDLLQLLDVLLQLQVVQDHRHEQRHHDLGERRHTGI